MTDMKLLVDDEFDRYEEAGELEDVRFPRPDIIADKVVLNRSKGVEEFYKSMNSGGFAKIGERQLDLISELKRYDQTLRDAGQTPSVEDYYAFGADDDQILQAGLQPQQPEPSERKEPLTEFEQLYVERQGDELLQAGPDQPLFENAISEVTKGLVRGGLVRPSQFLKENLNLYDPLVFQIVNPETGEFDPQLKIVSREEKAEIDQKIAAGEMPYAVDVERLVEADPASGAGAQVAGDLSQFIGAFAGIGKLFRLGGGIVGGATQGAAADFLAFRGDEGRLTDLLLGMGVPENQITEFLKTNPNDPDYVGRFKTALEGGIIGAVLEPVLIGMGKTFRAVKDGDVAPEALRNAVVNGRAALGEAFLKQIKNAEARIAERGDSTLYSNPVGPIVDRGLAAAGRFLDAPRARSVDEFAELAASGKLRQARTVTQDIADISEKKMPATVINLQGADDELSIAYESGEITDQLTQAGLFVDDDRMGTIYVGTTQENLDAIKSAENPAEIGKLSGYSDADIAAFYLKRRGGDKKAAFQEYRSDLADARAKERDQIRQRSREQTEAPDTSYRMEHQPRGPEDGEGIRLDDLTKNISGEQAGYPDDFYTSRGMEIYAQGPSFEGDEYGLANQESYEVIASVKENPDAEVTIYRAVPDEDAITTINPGDFVTLSPTYAKLHAASGYGRSGDEAGKVLEETVKVRDIYWDGNDVNEFGYFPEED